MLSTTAINAQDSLNSVLTSSSISSNGLVDCAILSSSNLLSLLGGSLPSALPSGLEVEKNFDIVVQQSSAIALSDSPLLVSRPEMQTIAAASAYSKPSINYSSTCETFEDSLTGYDQNNSWVGDWDADLTTLLETDPSAVQQPSSVANFETSSSIELIESEETSSTFPIIDTSKLISFADLQTDDSSVVTGLSIVNNAASGSTASSIQEIVGTFGADTFTTTLGYRYTVFSGNGNVDFGSGWRDYIDLSNVFSSSVLFNFADANGGGVVYNPGNCARVFDAMTLNDGRQILFEGIDSIRFADGVLNLSVTPNDPGFSSQWNLHMMGVQNAWRFTTGSASNVMIGIEDTGLSADYYGTLHPDLDASKTYVDYNNFSDESFGQISHGTAVQSIIAAETNNGIGMSGINWNTDVMHIDVLGTNDPGDYELADATQLLINQAASKGQRLVINMSLGGGNSDAAFEQLVAANQNNVLFVIASGNDDASRLSYPAQLSNWYSNIISIGASWGSHDVNGNSRELGTRISYPNGWGSNYGYGLSLMGPSEVLAADARQSYYGTNFSYTSEFNGTSAATPNVAGVASLVWSANPNLAASQVHEILEDTAYDLGFPGYDLTYGNGFVNADAAVRRAIALAVA